MQATPTYTPQPTRTPHAASTSGRLVTDAPTRAFHWLFALSFLGAYLSADGERWRLLHVTLGYTMAGLLVFRVLYGIWGPRQAGLGLMWRKLGGAPAWLHSIAQAWKARSLKNINWRQGQNLVMVLAVIALLAMVVPLTLSGYASFNDWGDFLGGDWLGDLHEFFGEAFLAVVLTHLALIAGLSLIRRKNQASIMVSGRVDGPGPHLVQKNRIGLASVLLASVLAYWAWEWQQSPNGLISGKALSEAIFSVNRDGDDD